MRSGVFNFKTKILQKKINKMIKFEKNKMN